MQRNSVTKSCLHLFQLLWTLLMHIEMRITAMFSMLSQRKRARLRLSCELLDNGQILHLLLQLSRLHQCCSFLGANGSIALALALNEGASLGTEGAPLQPAEAPLLKEGEGENTAEGKGTVGAVQRHASQHQNPKVF